MAVKNGSKSSVTFVQVRPLTDDHRPTKFISGRQSAVILAFATSMLEWE
jgi:hypothetical protein